MTKEDLKKIKEAVAEQNEDRACYAVETVLLKMGYYLAVPFKEDD